MRPPLRTGQLCCALCLLISTGAARASVPSYQTSFEQPDFSVGELRGQDGWQQTQGFSASTTVSKLKPKTGFQGVAIDMSTVPGFTYMGPPSPNLDPVALGLPLVTVTMDIAFTRRSGNSRSQFEFDSGTDTDPGHIAGFGVDGSNGVIYAFNNPNSGPLLLPAGTARPDEYGTLRADLNFATRRTTFYYNGRNMGTLPFATGAGTGLSDIVVATGIVAPVQSIDTWYFDNFSYAATPEPGAIGTLAAAAGLMLRRRRSKFFARQ